MLNTINTLYLKKKKNLCVGIKGQTVFEQRSTKESSVYDELLQRIWQNEVKSLLYFLIELMQNPYFLSD